MVANLERSRRTLGVEDPDRRYVILRHHSLQEAPEVGIYLTKTRVAPIHMRKTTCLATIPSALITATAQR